MASAATPLGSSCPCSPGVAKAPHGGPLAHQGWSGQLLRPAHQHLPPLLLLPLLLQVVVVGVGVVPLRLQLLWLLPQAPQP